MLGRWVGVRGEIRGWMCKGKVSAMHTKRKSTYVVRVNLIEWDKTCPLGMESVYGTRHVPGESV